MKLEKFVRQNCPEFVKLATKDIVKKLKDNKGFFVEDKGMHFKVTEEGTSRELDLLKSEEGFETGIYWGQNITKDKLVFVPRISDGSRVINPLAEKIASLLGFSKTEIQTPEEIVFLPFPRWYELKISGYKAEGNLEPLPMFKSEAKEAADMFIALLEGSL